MSLFHRYALFYNLQRYLADVDKLCDLALEGNVVEDMPGHEPSTAPRKLSPHKYIYEDPILEAEPSLLDDVERKEDPPSPKDDSTEEYKIYHPNDDKENRYEPEVFKEGYHSSGPYYGPHDDSDSHEKVTNVQLDGQDREHAVGLARDTGDDATQSNSDATTSEPGLTSDAREHFSDNTSTNSTDKDLPRFHIKRSQLNRMMACERLLYRLNSALIKNIHCIEDQENKLSSQTIQHFWQEAARLQGSERVKSIRVQERELAASRWWDDEPSWNDEKDTACTLGQERTQYKPVTGVFPRLSNSPLRKILDPDDLQWEEQVQEWQLGLGRMMDDKGRRFYKI